jgi:hypothetical protein
MYAANIRSPIATLPTSIYSFDVNLTNYISTGNLYYLSGHAYKNLLQNPILYSYIDSIGLSGSSSNLIVYP